MLTYFTFIDGPNGIGRFYESYILWVASIENLLKVISISSTEIGLNAHLMSNCSLEETDEQTFKFQNSSFQALIYSFTWCGSDSFKAIILLVILKGKLNKTKVEKT